MKTLTILLVALVSISVFAQDCNNYNDCYTMGKTQSGEAAIKTFTMALKYAKKENVNPSDAYFWRGAMKSKLIKSPNDKKEVEDVERDYFAALENAPGNYDIVNFLATFYQITAKDYAKGIAFMDKQINLRPNDPRTYYNRGHIHRYNFKNDLALTDFKKAYEIMQTGSTAVDISENDKGNIVLYYALLKLKNENSKIHNQETLDILEKANTITPKNEIVLSELALAYLDVGQLERATQIANETLQLQKFQAYQDAYKTKIPGAQIVLAFDAYQKADYENAAFRAEMAQDEKMRTFPHPALTLYAAIIKYDRYTRLYPDKWEAQKALITSRLEKAVELAKGTPYEAMGNAAETYLQKIKLPHGMPSEDANFKRDFEEFLINFVKLPTNFSMTLQSLEARDITRIPFVTKWLPFEDEVHAIGKIGDCNGNHLMVILLRSGGRNLFRFIKIGPKGEYLGWEPITSIQLYGGKPQYHMTVNINYRNGELIVNEKDTYFATGKSTTDERKVKCNIEWKK